MAKKAKGLTKRQREAVFRRTAILIHEQNPGISMEEAKQRAAKTMGPDFTVPKKSPRTIFSKGGAPGPSPVTPGFGIRGTGQKTKKRI